jgi:hypothetical protein
MVHGGGFSGISGGSCQIGTKGGLPELTFKERL